MELGKGQLRGHGINSLQDAFHPKHGLAWTDGKCIYLSAISVRDRKVERTNTIKLGEFGCVQCLYWSRDQVTTFCYMCVVHESTLSVWKVNGKVPDLHFKQVRKIKASPIPQGCLWNPRRDILCILRKEQCVFYFRHLGNKGSFALPPIESGNIICGCWSEDGRKLLVGIGSIVLIYQWKDIDRTITDYAIIAWKISSVDGRIRCMAPLSSNRIVCTAELPLEALCTSGDAFEVPDLSNNKGEDDSGFQSGEIILKPGNPVTENHKDALFNLQKSQQTVQHDYSQLIVFELQGGLCEPTKLAGADISGVLIPDLLYCDVCQQKLVVGCNNQNKIQIFQFTESQLHKVYQISFNGDERPKGICGIPNQTDGVLVMLGSLQKTDPAFLPSSLTLQYDLKLAFASAAAQSPRKARSNPGGVFKDIQLPNENRSVHLLRVSPLKSSGKVMETESLETHSKSNANEKEENFADFNLVLPGSDTTVTPKRKVLVFDADKSDPSKLELHSVSFEEKSPSFQVNSKSTSYPENSSGFKENIESTRIQDSPENFRSNSELESFQRHSSSIDSSYTQPFIEDRLYPDSTPESVKGHSGHFDSSDKPEFFSTPCSYKGYPGHHSGSDGSDLLCTPCSCNDQSGRYSKTSKSEDFTTPCSCKSHCGPCEPSDRASSPRSECSYVSAHSYSTELPNQVASMESQIKSQNSQILQLQEKLERLSKILEETSCVPKTDYNSANNPNRVYLVLANGTPQKGPPKAFLLDNGRIQLDQVKAVFNLATVELMLDGTPCVLGANIDGYIPIRFEAGTTLHITGTPNNYS